MRRGAQKHKQTLGIRPRTEAGAARRLDPEAIARLQLALGFRGDRLAVEQIATRLGVLTAVRASWSMAPALGVVRSRLTPIAPLGASGGTMGRSGGLGLMGAGSGMIQRAPAVPGMGGGMTRPPVGNYPFRLPPSLVGPTSGPSMSM